MSEDRAAIARRALALVDLTDLGDATTGDAAKKLCERAKRPVPSEPGLHVAAVCVWPRFVAVCRQTLEGSEVKIATVANFPTGGEPTDAVLATVRSALADGADEIDLVIDHRGFRKGETRAAGEGISAVKAVLPPHVPLKVILETGELGDAATMRAAARLAVVAGADILKTSTGKVPVNATPEAARVLLEVAAESARPIGVKASGGIRTVADAGVYLGLADAVMGTGWARPATFRFGASGLLDDLVAAISGQAGGGGGKGY